MGDIILEAKEDYWKGAPPIKTSSSDPSRRFHPDLRVDDRASDIVEMCPTRFPDRGAPICDLQTPTLRGLLLMDATGGARRPDSELKVRQAVSHAIT